MTLLKRSRWMDRTFHFRSKILWPGRCSDDRVKLNEHTDGRPGQRSCVRGAWNAVGTVSQFFHPSLEVVTPRFAFCSYPNYFADPEVLLLRRRLALRSTVQSRYILLEPNCIGIGLPNCSLPRKVIDIVKGSRNCYARLPSKID